MQVRAPAALSSRKQPLYLLGRRFDCAQSWSELWMLRTKEKIPEFWDSRGGEDVGFVFWVVMPCALVGGYRQSSETARLKSWGSQSTEEILSLLGVENLLTDLLSEERKLGKMTAFWDVAPSSLVATDRRFICAYCLYHHHHYPRKQSSSYSPLWQSEIIHRLFSYIITSYDKPRPYKTFKSQTWKFNAANSKSHLSGFWTSSVHLPSITHVCMYVCSRPLWSSG
jgi:hypothetical protein